MPGGKNGDLVAVTDVDAIRQQMKSILLMERYDDPFHPETSAGLRKLAFELKTPQTTALLKSMIENVMTRWVDRIDVKSVDVDGDDKEVIVTIMFKIKDIPEIQTFRTVLRRVR